jgi:hypothetical protein
MLRDFVQGFTILLLVCAVLLTVIAPPAWPFLLCAAVLAVGVFYERTLARGGGAPRGPGWAPTAERFRDTESGAMVTVWFNEKTGERRYVEAGGNRQD